MKLKRAITIILALFIIGSSAAYADNGTDDYTDGGRNGTDSEAVTIAAEATGTETKDAAEEATGTQTKDAAEEATGTETKDAAEEATGTETKGAAEEATGTETKDAAEEATGTETKNTTEEATGTEAGNTTEGNPEKKDADTVIVGADSELSTDSSDTGLKKDESSDSNIVITELTSGQNDSVSGETAATESGLTSTNGTCAQIDSFEFKLVENQDYTDCKEVNCSLRFQFTDTSSGTQYECFITALQIQEKDGESAGDRAKKIIAETKKDSVIRSTLTTKMTEIANNFLGRTDVVLKADNEIVDDLIDAEKYDNSFKVENLTDFQNAPYGDIQLCWAASTSDVLTYTGWSVNVNKSKDGTKDDGTKNEDATFAQFINAFYDNPGLSLAGYKWYLDGVNISEDHTNDNGDTELQTESQYGKENAKVRSTPTEATTISNTSYCADLLVEQYTPDESNGIDILADNLIDDMDEGNGVSLAYGHDVGGEYQGGHAVTVFGYIKELLKTGVDALKAIFISDSDNDCPAPTAALQPEKKASTTENIRENRPNTYTMYYVEPLTSSITAANTVRIYTSDARKAVEDAYPYKAFVKDTEVLKSIKTVEKEKIPCETEGTRDLKTSPDLTPASITLLSEEVTTGESVSVEVMFSNESYKAARAEDGNDLVIKYSLMVYDENDNFLYSIQNQATTEMIKAMGLATFSFNLPIDKAGIYGLGFQVDAVGYYDASGVWHEIKEAYTTNNVWTQDKKKITVKDPHISETIPYEIPTFCANYLLISEDPLTVSFNMDSKLGKIASLLDPKGNTVSADYYAITDNGDGTYTITFSAEFLQSLSVGQHKLTLQTENGKVYFIISIL